MYKFKKIAFLSCLIFGSTSLLHSQVDAQSNIAFMKLNAGYGNYGSAELGAFAPGLNTPDDDYFTLGIEFGATHNKLVYGYTLGSAYAPGITGNGYEMNRAGMNFGLGAGYLLLNKQHAKLYPNLNAGVSIYNVSITETEDLSLTQVQGSFGRELNLYQLNFMLDLSLNYDYYFKWTEDETGGNKGSYLIGAKAGYLYSLANDNWKYQGGDINNAPNWGMQGWYAQLTFGLGVTKDAK